MPSLDSDVTSSDRAPRNDDAASPDAFTRLFRDHLADVYGYLLHLAAGDRELAEDLTQDTFLSLARELRLGRLERADPRWLHVVARSRFIDHVRRARRADRSLRLITAGTANDLAFEPTGSQVLELMDRLEPLHRLVLMMRYVEGQSVPTIATAVGRSLIATNSLLGRARTRLRELAEGTS